MAGLLLSHIRCSEKIYISSLLAFPSSSNLPDFYQIDFPRLSVHPCSRTSSAFQVAFLPLLHAISVASSLILRSRVSLSHPITILGSWSQFLFTEVVPLPLPTTRLNLTATYFPPGSLLYHTYVYYYLLVTVTQKKCNIMMLYVRPVWNCTWIQVNTLVVTVVMGLKYVTGTGILTDVVSYTIFRRTTYLQCGAL